MRKKRENGMAKESGMGDFPRKQFESVLLHSLRIMDQNREYLQMHLARTGDERTRQALEDMGQESIRLERTLREMMGLLEVEMNDKPSMKPVDLCWILMEAAQMAPEIEKQLGIRLTVDHSPFRRCYVKADAQEAEQLLAAAGDPPEKVARILVETARARAEQTGRPDDITAAVLRLEPCGH